MAQPTYLSSARFLNGGFGFPTLASTGLSAAALRTTLVRATTSVNRYVSAPNIPQPFDFRGGAVVGEQHQWPFVAPLLVTAGSRRVYLNQKPVNTVTGFQLLLAKNYTVTLDPATNLVVNRQEGYVEVVALTPVISGYFPVGWNFGLWNPLALVDYTYGWSFDVAGDELVQDAVNPLLYTASYSNWDPLATVAVYQGDTPLTSGWTANNDDGSILFASPPTDPSVDYTYLCPDAVSQAVGIVATNLVGLSRNAARGMIGLQSIRVAEVALTQMQPSQMLTRNGVSIPAAAADLLGAFTMGSIG